MYESPNTSHEKPSIEAFSFPRIENRVIQPQKTPDLKKTGKSSSKNLPQTISGVTADFGQAHDQEVEQIKLDIIKPKKDKKDKKDKRDKSKKKRSKSKKRDEWFKSNNK